MSSVLNINPSIVEGFPLYHEGVWWNEVVDSYILNLVSRWM